jgi:putative hydrolase of the HAD superfamily
MIFFDIDDTLLDDRHAQDAAARAFWREFAHQIPYAGDEFLAVWESISSKHYQRFTAGEVSFTDQRRCRIREVFAQPNLPDADADARFTRYLAYHQASWKLFADTLPCLAALAGERLGVITNGDPVQQRLKLETTRLTSLFSPIVVSGDIGKPKPQPEIFLHACKLANVRPEECTYIGDNLVFDVFGSRAVGMRGVWLNRRGASTEGIDQPIITTLAELPDLLR